MSNPMMSRMLVGCVAAALLGVAGVSAALAQTAAWPSKPLRILLPVAPGGATDATARLLQQPLADALGQPVVIENKPGGGGITATDTMLRSGDGHTIALVNSPHAANVAMQPKLPYDTAQDIAAIGFIWRAPSAISVHPSVAARSLKDLIEQSRKSAVSYGTPGIGFSMHLAGELLRLSSGAELTHVPYRGAGPALNDALGGQIPMVISNVASSAPHAQAGKLVPLAVTGAKRSALLPNVPTVAEQGFPNYDVIEWLIAVAPVSMPAADRERFNGALNKVLTSPELVEKFKGLGLEAETLSAPDTDKFVRAEIDKLGKIIRAANIRPE